MTLGRTEFLRLLPAAVGGDPFELDASRGEILARPAEGRRWRIRLAPLPPINLGPVAMERLQVELEFEGYPPEAVAAFIERFMTHYLRGGG